jgi:hypothetical protein
METILLMTLVFSGLFLLVFQMIFEFIVLKRDRKKDIIFNSLLQVRHLISGTLLDTWSTLNDREKEIVGNTYRSANTFVMNFETRHTFFNFPVYKKLLENVYKLSKESKSFHSEVENKKVIHLMEQFQLCINRAFYLIVPMLRIRILFYILSPVFLLIYNTQIKKLKTFLNNTLDFGRNHPKINSHSDGVVC